MKTDDRKEMKIAIKWNKMLDYLAGQFAYAMIAM
jgi:hypothetical protein